MQGGGCVGGYYLKTHYKSIGSYPDKAVHFPEGCDQLARDFAACDSFLLYETKKGDRPGLEGAGTIWGMGQPAGGVIAIAGQEVNGRTYTLAVPVRIILAVKERNRGVPAPRVQEIVGRPLGFTGGLWRLTPDQFFILLRELEECISQEELLGINLEQWKKEGVQGRF
jgi:hypothetical protein